VLGRTVVADDKLDAGEVVSSSARKKLGPARPALGLASSIRLAPAILVERCRNKDGLADDDSVLAHPFVARADDEKEVALEPPGNRLQARVERLVDPIDR